MKMEVENEMITAASQAMPASQSALTAGYFWELLREQQSDGYLPQVVLSPSNYNPNTLTLTSDF